MSTFAEVVRSLAGDERTGLLFGADRWTWAQVVQESADRASLLAALRDGDRQLHVGVLLENTPDHLFWLGAAALSGSVLIGINPTRRGQELARDVRHTDCDLIITEDRLSDLLGGIDHGVPAERVLNVDAASHQEIVASHRGAALPDTLPDPGATLLLMFSSGSTGAPKAVICTQDRLGKLAAGLAVRAELTRDSVSYLCMPLFHGNAMMLNVAPAMQVGATICMVRKFSASGFVRDLHQFGLTYLNYVGRALSYVLAAPEDPRDRDSTLQLAVGTEASVADIERFSARFGCRVSEGYGLSEGVLRINRTPDSPPDSLGLPVGGIDVRVMNEESGAECPRARIDQNGGLVNAEEAIGQIVAVGQAASFEGYYKNPEAQAERARGDDFWTGDLGYRDEAGYFYFAGRSADRLRVDSENFAAGPVERIINRWSKVLVSLVYAVPDPRTGDQVMCTVQMADGVQFVPEEFTAFLDAQPDLGTKWRPRFVRIVDHVPTTGSNKVTKTPLRREGWVSSDPVFWRLGTETTYRPLDGRQREAIAQEFADHGRTALLPASG